MSQRQRRPGKRRIWRQKMDKVVLLALRPCQRHRLPSTLNQCLASTMREDTANGGRSLNMKTSGSFGTGHLRTGVPKNTIEHTGTSRTTITGTTTMTMARIAGTKHQTSLPSIGLRRLLLCHRCPAENRSLQQRWWKCLVR